MFDSYLVIESVKQGFEQCLSHYAQQRHLQWLRLLDLAQSLITLYQVKGLYYC